MEEIERQRGEQSIVKVLMEQEELMKKQGKKSFSAAEVGALVQYYKTCKDEEKSKAGPGLAIGPNQLPEAGQPWMSKDPFKSDNVVSLYKTPSLQDVVEVRVRLDNMYTFKVGSFIFPTSPYSQSSFPGWGLSRLAEGNMTDVVEVDGE